MPVLFVVGEWEGKGRRRTVSEEVKEKKRRR